MAEVPQAVVAALAGRRAVSPTEPQQTELPDRVLVGDVMVAKPLSDESAGRRLVLVIGVDTTSGSAEVYLIHSAPELATSRDVVVEGSLVGTPYDVVVQTDLHGVVWSFQLDRRIGHFDELAIANVRTLGSGTPDPELVPSREAVSQAIYCGSELVGVLDRRWSFKEAEGSALRRLTADCTEALIDDDCVWQVDQKLLLPDHLNLAAAPESLLGELIHWVGTRRLSMADDDLERLVAAGVLEPEYWATFGDLAMDVASSLQDWMVNASADSDIGEAGELVGLLAPAHLGQVDGAEEADRVRYLGSKELVRS